ncbi:hypothetical protein HYX12_03835, partial [Candidatus Woesearchaeota archaeon]|nr:hypothetical protein [Candidatus Woesearchaeota archaeon]
MTLINSVRALTLGIGLLLTSNIVAQPLRFLEDYCRLEAPLPSPIPHQSPFSWDTAKIQLETREKQSRKELEKRMDDVEEDPAFKRFEACLTEDKPVD